MSRQRWPVLQRWRVLLRWPVLANRVILFGLVWWILTDGAVAWDALAVGGPAVVLAAALSSALLPRVRLSGPGTLRFAGFFLRRSWSGAVDVARRAFDPRIGLEPGILDHRLRVERDLARVTVANTGSLLPGTLSVELEDAHLCMHVLDTRALDPDEEIVALTERRVAAMLDLPEPGPPPPAAHAEPVPRPEPGRRGGPR